MGDPRSKELPFAKCEGQFIVIRDHIEANHFEGVSLPCDYCDKVFSTRAALKMHKSRNHK